MKFSHLFDIFGLFNKNASQKLIFYVENSLIPINVVFFLQICFVVRSLKIVEEDDKGAILSLLDLFLLGVFLEILAEGIELVGILLFEGVDFL